MEAADNKLFAEIHKSEHMHYAVPKEYELAMRLKRKGRQYQLPQYKYDNKSFIPPYFRGWAKNPTINFVKSKREILAKLWYYLIGNIFQYFC